MPELFALSLFSEVAALLILAGAVGLIGHFLKQPLVVSYIVVGILAGPSVVGLARSEGPLERLSDLGIAVLLFLVGLKMDYRLIRSLGFVSLTTGLGGGSIHVRLRLPDRPRARLRHHREPLHRRRPYVLEHHHHREAADR